MPALTCRNHSPILPWMAVASFGYKLMISDLTNTSVAPILLHINEKCLLINLVG